MVAAGGDVLGDGGVAGAAWGAFVGVVCGLQFGAVFSSGQAVADFARDSREDADVFLEDVAVGREFARSLGAL